MKDNKLPFKIYIEPTSVTQLHIPERLLHRDKVSNHMTNCLNVSMSE